MKMRRTLMSTLGAVMLILAVTVAPATAAGTTKVECTIDGVTQIKGPVPKGTYQIHLTWYSTRPSITDYADWTGGSKRWTTPPGSLLVDVDFYGGGLLLQGVPCN